MIILTGASGGIGKAVLPHLAKLDHVIATYFTRRPDNAELPNVTYSRLDLSSEKDVSRFVAELDDLPKRITLIHGAALSRDKLSINYKTDDWDEVLSVNLRGDFLLTRALLMPMMRDQWGRIIHISSIAGSRGVPGTAAYSATKTGLAGISRVFANEYARFGITSNVLQLGYFNTGLIETLSEKVRTKIMDAIPSGKLGDPMNIVNAVEFLIRSDYVNGSIISIDGGM